MTGPEPDNVRPEDEPREEEEPSNVRPEDEPEEL